MIIIDEIALYFILRLHKSSQQLRRLFCSFAITGWTRAQIDLSPRNLIKYSFFDSPKQVQIAISDFVMSEILKQGRKSPRYTQIDGFRVPATFIPEIFRSSVKYRPGEGEVIVATFPKCGTTWMLQIAMLVLRRGRPFESARDYFAARGVLEISSLHSGSSAPACWKTHLPFDRINFSTDAKYIYVARHPADCAVSFYHHARYFPIYFFSDGTFDDFFEVFVRGETDFGDYFDHLRSWYERRHEPNVLFTTFEATKADPRGAVLKVAEFLGHGHHDALLANGGEVLEKVLHHSSFESMKQTVDLYANDIYNHTPLEIQQNHPVMKKYSEVAAAAIREGHSSTGNFVRKGLVGEGKIVLSDEQWDKLNKRIAEKTKGSDVMSLWKDLC